MLSEQNEENNIIEKNRNYNNSILNEDANTTYSDSNKNGMSMNISMMSMSMSMNQKEEVLKESKKVKKRKRKPIITDEMKEQIEKMVDLQFEEEFNKLNNEYEEKIEELLIEQEKIINKNEIIKAKYDALESYLKNYCKMANIDYEKLLDDEKLII